MGNQDFSDLHWHFGLKNVISTVLFANINILVVFIHCAICKHIEIHSNCCFLRACWCLWSLWKEESIVKFMIRTVAQYHNHISSVCCYWKLVSSLSWNLNLYCCQCCMLNPGNMTVPKHSISSEDPIDGSHLYCCVRIGWILRSILMGKVKLRWVFWAGIGDQIDV